MAEVPVPVLFLAVAGITLAGFWAGRLFQRTRIPDPLPLVGIGLLLGPVNRWAAEGGFGWQGLADVMAPANLQVAAPVIAGLALVVLLFESGMQLDFAAFGRSVGPAFLFTVPVYLLTVLVVSVVGHWVLGMPLIVAVVFGVVMVNVDQAVSSGILQKMRIDGQTRSIYFVEMALYDLISIPLFVSLLEFASGAASGYDAAGFLKGFMSLLSVSLALGFAGGILWVFALRRLKGHPHSYMLTFAVMLGGYGLAEFLGGSGALSTLIFGLLLGNRSLILRRFGRVRLVDDEHEKVQAFHDEVAFFVRTAFFLFLGASFTFGLSGGAAQSLIPGLAALDHTTTLLVLGALLMLVGIVAARAIPVLVMASRNPVRKQLFPVFGRGLDTAVLATVPFLVTSYTTGASDFGPWKEVFLNLSLYLILFTVVASGLAVWWTERRLGPPPRQAPETGPEVVVPGSRPQRPQASPAPAKGRAGK